MKYPNVHVRLDGGSRAILERVTRALLRAGVEQDERARYIDEATRGDRSRLMEVTSNWVGVVYSAPVQHVSGAS